MLERTFATNGLLSKDLFDLLKLDKQKHEQRISSIDEKSRTSSTGSSLLMKSPYGMLSFSASAEDSILKSSQDASQCKAKVHLRWMNARHRAERAVGLGASSSNNLAAPAVPVRDDELGALALELLADLDQLGDVVRGVGKTAEPLLELLLVLVRGRRETVHGPGLIALEEVGHDDLRFELVREDVGALLGLWEVPGFRHVRF